MTREVRLKKRLGVHLGSALIAFCRLKAFILN